MSDDVRCAVPLAQCEVCRGMGGCVLGFAASWRYVSTKPDPYTGYGHTKMDELTKPMEGNQNKPPVKAYGKEDGPRFIVGMSMCKYVRSHEVPARKPQRKITKAGQPPEIAAPSMPSQQLTPPAPPPAAGPARPEPRLQPPKHHDAPPSKRGRPRAKQ